MIVAPHTANRLTSVNGVTQTWDLNGNLRNDGAGTAYIYDAANRLTTITQGASSYAYVYNGAGDRVQQTVNGVVTQYTLDLNASLTQVLADGTTTYLYGYDRILQNSTGPGKQYFLTDALGSARVLMDSAQTVTLQREYEPYGKVLSTSGTGATAYGFTGEWTDSNGLLNLRARFYSPGTGRFLSRDTRPGDYRSPHTLNPWNYVGGNPITYTDPSGHCFTGIVVDTFVCAAIEITVLAVGIFGTFHYGYTYSFGPDAQRNSAELARSIEAVAQSFSLEPVDNRPVGFPLPEERGPQVLVFPLPEPRPINPLIFVLENLEPFVENFPLDSGLPPILHTPPFPGQLPVELQGPTVHMAKPLEWDPEPRRLIDLSNRDRYVVFDSLEPRFQAAGILEWNGELSITLRTRLENGERTPLMTGSEQFGQILDHFGNRVKAIRGHWLYGDNLQAFNEATRLGMSPEQAALMTWTGQQAVAAGFGKVKIDRLEGEPGEYTDVRVRFTK